MKTRNLLIINQIGGGNGFNSVIATFIANKHLCHEGMGACLLYDGVVRVDSSGNTHRLILPRHAEL